MPPSASDMALVSGRETRHTYQLAVPEDTAVPHVRLPDKKMEFRDDDYHLPEGFKGFALIIKIQQFVNPSKTRTPYVLETINMVHILQQLGYKVTVREGFIDYTEFCSILDSFIEVCRKQSESPPSSIMVFIESFGGYRDIECSDGRLLNLYKQVINRFTDSQYPELTGKPKIFFIQNSGVSNEFEDPDLLVKKQADGFLADNVEDTVICFSESRSRALTPAQNHGKGFTNALSNILVEEAHCKDFFGMIETVRTNFSRDCPELSFTCHKIRMKKIYFNLAPRNRYNKTLTADYRVVSRLSVVQHLNDMERYLIAVAKSQEIKGFVEDQLVRYLGNTKTLIEYIFTHLNPSMFTRTGIELIGMAFKDKVGIADSGDMEAVLSSRLPRLQTPVELISYLVDLEMFRYCDEVYAIKSSKNGKFRRDQIFMIDRVKNVFYWKLYILSIKSRFPQFDLKTLENIFGQWSEDIEADISKLSIVVRGEGKDQMKFLHPAFEDFFIARFILQIATFGDAILLTEDILEIAVHILVEELPQVEHPTDDAFGCLNLFNSLLKGENVESAFHNKLRLSLLGLELQETKDKLYKQYDESETALIALILQESNTKEVKTRNVFLGNILNMLTVCVEECPTEILTNLQKYLEDIEEIIGQNVILEEWFQLGQKTKSRKLDD